MAVLRNTLQTDWSVNYADIIQRHESEKDQTMLVDSRSKKV